MSVCTACAAITPITRQLMLHPDIASLRESAQLCRLCLLILEALERTSLIVDAENYRAHVHDTYQLINDTSITISTNGHLAPVDEKAHALIISCGPIKRYDSTEQRVAYNAGTTWLGIEAEDGSAAAALVATRPIAEDPRNKTTLGLIKKWIKTCEDGHDKCQMGYTREETRFAGPTDDEGTRLRAKYNKKDCALPTRVIDVFASEDGVRLVESQTIGGRGCYIALSHVWGKVAHFKTERLSYEAHKDKIPLPNLPQTFQDAVIITRDLGIRYLWIDSLCIIQDSALDWEQEASRMASVYMNAYVTISATSAADSNGGCLNRRQFPPSIVVLPYVVPETAIPDGTWTIHNRTTSWDDHVRKSVLATRAWTLQEKQLARRTLHYAADQVSFECKTGFEFETQRPGQTVGEQTFYFQMLYWTIVSFRSADQTAVKGLIAGLVNRTWSRVIEDYSLRKLTFEKDKLPAVAGLAQYASQLTLDRYHFGLWETQLDLGLLWRTAPYEDASECRGRVEGRAPTWSWASVDGRVYFASNGDKPIEQGHTTGSALDVVGVTLDGRLTVESRTLTLRLGKLGIQGQWDWDQWIAVYKRTPRNPLLGGHDRVRSDDCSWFGFAAMDEDKMRCDEEGRQRVVEALLVTRGTIKTLDGEDPSDDPFKKTCFVLFLEESGVKDTYRRIGMGQVFLCAEVDLPEKRRIHLV